MILKPYSKPYSYPISLHYFSLELINLSCRSFLHRGNLMKIIKCRDLGFKCNFMAAGNELKEVETAIFDHIEKQYAVELKDMSEDDIRHLRHRISTLLGRSCGCGAL